MDVVKEWGELEPVKTRFAVMSGEGQAAIPDPCRHVESETASWL